MQAHSAKHADRRPRGLTISLVAAAFAGIGMAASEAPPGEASADTLSAGRTAQNAQAAAKRREAEAMYRLAMMHIEGSMPHADYDYGVDLLKASAFRGNRDAERMYDFMNSAFSGEGC